MHGGITDELYAFLTDPQIYGKSSLGKARAEGASEDRVEVIETHAALVFLCGERALKVKKAVRYPYLDFSKPQLRRAALSRELELNRANAPDLYRGLIEICRRPDGRLALAGGGEPVETALDMRRFDNEQLFDRLAERHALSLSLMAPLADTVKRAHVRTDPVFGIDPVDSLRQVLIGNTGSLLSHADLFDRARVNALDRRSVDWLDRNASLLRERAQAGLVRRCHGDLHLGNIVLWHVRPTLFDALEFDEALATTDVLYDLAFLLMDLCHRALPDHANRVLNRYLARDEPAALAGLSALPLMMSIRASVRAKIAADRAVAFDQQDEIKRSKDAAHAYLDLAEDCLNRPPARLIAVAGLSGSGKSTVAAKIAAAVGGQAGALQLRTDVERKALAGVDDDVCLSQEHYTPAQTSLVYSRLHEKADIALRAGASVVFDAVNARTTEREKLEQLSRCRQVTFDGLWLDAHPDILKARVGSRSADASDADAAVVTRQLAFETGPIAWTRIDANGTPEETWQQVSATLGIGGRPKPTL